MKRVVLAILFALLSPQAVAANRRLMLHSGGDWSVQADINPVELRGFVRLAGHDDGQRMAIAYTCAFGLDSLLSVHWHGVVAGPGGVEVTARSHGSTRNLLWHGFAYPAGGIDFDGDRSSLLEQARGGLFLSVAGKHMTVSGAGFARALEIWRAYCTAADARATIECLSRQRAAAAIGLRCRR